MVNTKVSVKPAVSVKMRIVLAVVGALALLIANSAFWVNNYVFNKDNFTTTATTALLSESSREAIADGVVDRALADRPVAKQLIGDIPANIITGVLGTDQVAQAATAAVGRLQVYMTSNDRQDVALDLTGVKALLTRLIEVTGREDEARIDPNNIPDNVVLVEADSVPSFYETGVVFLWLAPLMLIVALVSFGYPYYRQLSDWQNLASLQGAVLVLTGMLALSFGPLFRPPLLANINAPNARIIVENIYNSFIATFNSQTYTLIVLGTLMLAVSVGFQTYKYITHKR